MQLHMQLAQESAHAKLARDLGNEVKADLFLKLSFAQNDDSVIPSNKLLIIYNDVLCFSFGA